MGTAASGSAVKLFYVQEVAGAIPANPVFIPIRFNTEGLARDVTQIDSNEINPLRQRPVSRQGTFSVAGDIVVEASFGSSDALIAAALQGTWAPRSALTGVTFSVDATDNSFNDSALGFVAAGFVVGDTVITTGFATGANNGSFVVTAVTTGKLTIGGTDGDALVTEVAGATATINSGADVLDVGSTVPTFAILQRHTDINVDYISTGIRVGTMTLNAPLNSPATMTFGVIGEDFQPFTIPGGATFAAATTTQMMVTSNGGMTEGGVVIDFATDYSMVAGNNIAPLFSLFQRPAFAVQNGIFTVTGTLSAYLPDAALFNKFLTETPTAHVVTIEEGADSYVFTLPSVIYTQAAKSTDGDGAIIVPYTFSAGFDGALNTTLRITRSA